MVSEGPRSRILDRSTPWESIEAALGFLDRDVRELLGPDIIAELLQTARGETSGSYRVLDEQQFAILKRHRVVPLIPATWTAERSSIQNEKTAITAWGLKLDAATVRAVSLLDSADVNTTLLKGNATGRLDYPTPSLRHCGDLDVLVPVTDFEKSVRSLTRAGYTRMAPKQFDDEFTKGTTLVDATGVEVDIHTRISLHGKTGYQSLALADFVSLNEIPAQALSVNARLVHAASHLFYTEPGYRRLSGLADICAIRSQPIDLAAVRQVAIGLDLEAATFSGLAIESLLSDRNPLDLASWRRPGLSMRLAYARSNRAQWAEQLFRLSELDGLSARLRYLRQKALPNPQAVAYRGGWIEYLRRGIR